ncbi:Hypothetical predicted protein [Cloeon dipterum]|uniref:Uncharacterized protein n=1 Tax=Cloeon dipterum TaxID=197152 RepID=A0A8S1E827_9INSE|nr:Hypothetical predicted protein [Cloeon dipterum]
MTFMEDDEAFDLLYFIVTLMPHFMLRGKCDVDAQKYAGYVLSNFAELIKLLCGVPFGNNKKRLFYTIESLKRIEQEKRLFYTDFLLSFDENPDFVRIPKKLRSISLQF